MTGRRKEKQLSMRVSEDFHELVAKTAETEGISITDLIVKAVYALTGESSTQPDPVLLQRLEILEEKVGKLLTT